MNLDTAYLIFETVTLTLLVGSLPVPGVDWSLVLAIIVALGSALAVWTNLNKDVSGLKMRADQKDEQFDAYIKSRKEQEEKDIVTQRERERSLERALDSRITSVQQIMEQQLRTDQSLERAMRNLELAVARIEERMKSEERQNRNSQTLQKGENSD